MRTRLIHADMILDERLGAVSLEPRLLYVLLMSIADREGRLEDRPRRIAVELYPYDRESVDEASIVRWLDDLAGAGLIRRYEVASQRCIHIPDFSRWQKPHPRETESALPPPPSADVGTPSADLGTPQADLGEPQADLGAALAAPRRPVSVSDPVWVSVRERPSGAALSDADGSDPKSDRSADSWPEVIYLRTTAPFSEERGRDPVLFVQQVRQSFPGLDHLHLLREAKKALDCGDEPAKPGKFYDYARKWIQNEYNRADRKQPKARTPGDGSIPPERDLARRNREERERMLKLERENAA